MAQARAFGFYVSSFVLRQRILVRGFSVTSLRLETVNSCRPAVLLCVAEREDDGAVCYGLGRRRKW